MNIEPHAGSVVADLELATNSRYLHMITHDECPYRGFLGGMRLASPSSSSFILACQKQGVTCGTNELGHGHDVTIDCLKRSFDCLKSSGNASLASLNKSMHDWFAPDLS